MKIILTFLALLILIPMVLYMLKEHDTTRVASVKFISPLPQEDIPDSSFKPGNIELENAISEILSKRNGEYGIYYKNLVSGEVYVKNANRQFDSASLYKLWIMGELFRQIDQGKIKKEDPIKESIPALNARFGIASESAELREGAIDTTVEDALEKMITISDNYSALALSSKVRLSNVTTFLKMYDFSQSSIGTPPRTSPNDIGLFFDKLYKGEIVAPMYSKEMLAILKRQRLNDRLPKYLPKDVQVAHKTGELNGFKHDAGIIYHPNGAYVLVVLSKSNNEVYAAETIAMISREVYKIKSEE